MTKVNKMMINVTNKQVKQVVRNFPHYLGDCLIVNYCTQLGVFNILRIEAIVANQVRYLDIIINSDTNDFLGLGQCSDKTTDFTISCNICKTLSLVAYMKEAY